MKAEISSNEMYFCYWKHLKSNFVWNFHVKYLSASRVGQLLTWLIYLSVVVSALDLGLSYLLCLWMYIKWQFHFAVYTEPHNQAEKWELYMR